MRTLLAILSLLTPTMLAGACSSALAAAQPPAPPASADTPKVLWHKVPYEAADADEALAGGIKAYNAGNFDLAIAAFSKALVIRPKFVDAHYNLGIAFDAVRDYDRAIAEFIKVIDAKPKLYDAYVELGEIYLKKGDIEKARFNADAALKIKPGSKDAAQLVADIAASVAGRKP